MTATQNGLLVDLGAPVVDAIRALLAQAVTLDRDLQASRWRHGAGVGSCDPNHDALEQLQADLVDWAWEQALEEAPAHGPHAVVRAVPCMDRLSEEALLVGGALAGLEVLQDGRGYPHGVYLYQQVEYSAWVVRLVLLPATREARVYLEVSLPGGFPVVAALGDAPAPLQASVSTLLDSLCLE